MLKRVLLLSLVLIAVPSVAAADSNSHTPVTVATQHDNANESYINTGGNDGDNSSAANTSTGSTQTFPRKRSGAQPVDNAPTTTTLPQSFYNCSSNSPGTASDYYIVYGGQYDMCVNKLTVKDPTPDYDEVQADVQNFFETTHLPIPQPEISAKNGGICGVEHTLNLHMSATQTTAFDGTDFGNVNIIVHAYETDVDWGDKTPVSKYAGTNTGAAFPNSSIGHSWSTAGTYNVTVTTHWTAEWTVLPTDGGPAYGGVLDRGASLTTTGAIPNFNVVSAQAVITE